MTNEKYFEVVQLCLLFVMYLLVSFLVILLLLSFLLSCRCLCYVSVPRCTRGWYSMWSMIMTLTYKSRVDFPTLISRTSPFLILGVLDGIFHFYSNF